MAQTHRVFRGLAGILRTHYPNYALGLPLGRYEIPVFVYHDVDAESFAADLEFLRLNNYQTLGLEEFVRLSASGKAGRNKVLLTFDDARRSFADVALPVLRQFGARATLFAPTFWVNDGPPPVAAATDAFMSWNELRDCVSSGLVDVQSHAHRHALVCTSGRLVGFATPKLLARFHVYDWPMRHTDDGDQIGRPPLGTPIYEAAPLLSATGRFVESQHVGAACCKIVTQAGGAGFFSHRDSSKELRRTCEREVSRHPGRWLPPPEFQALVASEFELSRDLFRLQLGYAPTFLAYPWMLGSRLSLDLAHRYGIRAAFGVALDYGAAARRDLPVAVFGRLKADWLPALPGTGRTGIVKIAARKLASFTETLHLAH